MWGDECAECEKSEGEKCECGREFCRCGEGGTETPDEGDQDDFTNRVCGFCNEGFDLSDSHYYDEEEGECYCSEDCFRKEKARWDDESETDEGGEVYYILSNYNLTQVESKPSVEEYEEESRIVVNGRTEITYKKIGSDEGGNDDRVEY